MSKIKENLSDEQKRAGGYVPYVSSDFIPGVVSAIKNVNPYTYKKILAALLLIGMASPLQACSVKEPTIQTDPSEKEDVQRLKFPLYYRIGAGDSLDLIARAFGVTKSDIMRANSKISSAHQIFAGDVIIINSAAVCPGSMEHLVCEGETLEDICDMYNRQYTRYNITPEDITALNGNNIMPGDYIELPVTWSGVYDAGNLNGLIFWDEASAYEYFERDSVNIDENDVIVEYTILPGESLDIIAEKFGVTRKSILSVNPDITNPNLVRSGQTIRIVNPTRTPEENINTEGSEETSDFVAVPEGCKRIIDFASLAGEVDWDKLEAAYKRGEIDGVILRVSENWNKETEQFEFVIDPRFEENVQECNRRGIDYGGYSFFRGFEGPMVDDYTKSLLEFFADCEERGINIRFKLPFYGDFEKGASTQYSLLLNGEYEKYVSLMLRFVRNMEKAGIFSGLYYNGEVAKLIRKASNYPELASHQLWYAGGANYNVNTPVASVGSDYLFKVFGGNLGGLQVTQYGEIDGIAGSVDVSLFAADLMEVVTRFYINKYGEDYYKNNLEPSLRGEVGQQIRYAPSRQERRHPGSTYEGVTSSLAAASMDSTRAAEIRNKSTVMSGSGARIRHTQGNPGNARFNKGCPRTLMRENR